MFRTHTCGQLRLADAGSQVTLAGWVQRIRLFGHMVFVDLRDRYGITQLVFDPQRKTYPVEQAKQLGREDVVQVTGTCIERINKNPNLPTGEIEILVQELVVLNASAVPPFTIEAETDGGEELRMKYRYLDLRRPPLQQNLLMRHKVAQAVRQFLDAHHFVDIETPFLIKSTPEGARDFLVPSRLNPGQFYALPQSPQTFKQLLMVSGFDRYYQIVRCFRDEDLRADRQPEFTQIDCEMAFVHQQDVLRMFEAMVGYVFEQVRGITLPPFAELTYEQAMRRYGTDKPDLRFDMPLHWLKDATQNRLADIRFPPFERASCVGGICVKQGASLSRKQIDELNDFVRRPQIGAEGLLSIKWNVDNSFKSSADKYFDADQLRGLCEAVQAAPGDLLLLLAGNPQQTTRALGTLRLEVATRLGLRQPDRFCPVWIVDFPLLEWNEQEHRWQAMHHPFTSWKKEDEALLDTNPGNVRANAYDLVINGVELGGGSIRIVHRADQEKMFALLGLSQEQAERQFGFLLKAFEYGTPPHGGIAFGFDRFCSMVIAGQEGIRDFIAFPKNNLGRDVMLDAPSEIDEQQRKELNL